MTEEAAYDELSEKYERLVVVHSVALDEIYLLRAAMAYEHGVTKVHASYASFPKSRRSVLESQLDRMAGAAGGFVAHAYSEQRPRLPYYLRDVGASATLTRAEYEEAHANVIACYPRPVGKDGENFDYDRTSTNSSSDTS